MSSIFNSEKLHFDGISPILDFSTSEISVYFTEDGLRQLIDHYENHEVYENNDIYNFEKYVPKGRILKSKFELLRSVLHWLGEDRSYATSFGGYFNEVQIAHEKMMTTIREAEHLNAALKLSIEKKAQ